jgi:AcrR family transcriptional regulator
MPRTSDAKERMIRSAMRLQRRHGVAGTAFSDVLQDSGAPRGSIYHHFPDGRAQLSEAATAYGAAWMAERLEALLDAGEPEQALDGFVAFWLELLREEHYEAGCAVAAGALDPDATSGARRAAQAGFRRWRELLAHGLTDGGVAPARAEGLATLCLAAVEGALVLCRAEGTPAPLEQVAVELRAVLAAAR